MVLAGVTYLFVYFLIRFSDASAGQLIVNQRRKNYNSMEDVANRVMFNNRLCKKVVCLMKNKLPYH